MLIGKRISDRYKIIEWIGGGGMANVYLARDIILERYVAVKVLRLDYANDDEFIRRFRREAQSAISLVHPNIVSIYDVGEEDNIYYIVMEYVEGETLKQYIQNHYPIPVERTVEIMSQLASAIRHAHENNIIHRDIKPQNILIDRRGNVKVTDFGIAMALSSTTITQTNSVLGSVHYISPEQARGGVVTKKSDIYSLGIVMFELLTGHVPFTGDSAVSIALKQLHDPIPSPRRFNPGIPQSVENIVLKATAKDPIYRYDDVYELEEDLRTCLEPDRLNEPPFVPPADEEATKSIPLIRDGQKVSNLQDTVTLDEKKKDEAPVNKKKGKKPFWKKWPFWVALFSVLIVIMGVLFILFFNDWFGPDEIEIPDVSGMEIEAATEELKNAGLKVGDMKMIPDEEIPEEHVIRTDPKAGKLVKEGTEVKLFVSSGKEKVVLSDYTGRTYDEVFNLLKDRFYDIRKEEVYDDREAGIILEQTPSPGEEVVPEETVLEFKVSKGPETFTLADLTNYSSNALNDYAASRGIKIEVSGEEYHDTIPSGLVISQNPAAGTEIKKGDTVKVVVSKGRPPVEKTVQVTVPYTGAGGAPQEAFIYVEDMENTYDTPVWKSNITGTQWVKVHLLVSPEKPAKIRVIVNNQVVLEESVSYND
jgi:serine/threonine protein kinase